MSGINLRGGTKCSVTHTTGCRNTAAERIKLLLPADERESPTANDQRCRETSGGAAVCFISNPFPLKMSHLT